MNKQQDEIVLADARALIARGALAEAHKLLVAFLQKNDNADGYLLLSQIFEASGHLPQAEECFLHVLRGAPEHATALKGFAEFYTRNNATRAARRYWETYVRLHPGDLLAVMAYAGNLGRDRADEEVAILERTLAQVRADDLLTLKVMERLIGAKEQRERQRRGLMPYHSHSLDDMGFPFTAEDVQRFREIAARAVASAPEKPLAHVFHAIAQFANDRSAALEGLLAPAREEIGGLPFLNIRDRDGRFFEALAAMTDADILRGLPPVETILASDFTDAPVVFLSSDGDYFGRYAVPLLRSISAQGKAQVHVHLMSASPDQHAQAKRVVTDLGLPAVITAEALPDAEISQGKRAAHYFHAVRFIRFYETLRRSRRPLWLMDVDVLFNRPPATLFATLGENDVAFRVRPARWEPWHQFNACVIGAAPTQPSLDYFRLIAAYIAHFYQAKEMTWGIDQLAMYAVFDYMRMRARAPTVALLDNHAIDYASTDAGIVWADSGKAKHRAITPLASLDPHTARYRALFAKYQDAARGS